MMRSAAPCSPAPGEHLGRVRTSRSSVLLTLAVNRCVPLAELDETIRALAKRLANGPTQTYQLIKELMYKSLDMDLQTSLHLEGQLQEAAYATADHRESVDAFLHKRAAKFTGK